MHRYADLGCSPALQNRKAGETEADRISASLELRSDGITETTGVAAGMGQLLGRKPFASSQTTHYVAGGMCLHKQQHTCGNAPSKSVAAALDSSIKSSFTFYL